MNFTEYANQCVAEWRQDVKESTFSLYQYRVNALIHVCGGFELQYFSTKKIQEIANLLSEHFSKNSVLDFLVFIRMVLRHAMRHEIIPERNFERIRVLAKKLHKDRQCLSDEEFIQLAEYCSKHPVDRGSVCCMLALFAGLRIGEIAALKWNDVHFTGNYLHIQRTRQRVYYYGRKSEIIDGDAKSACSIRIIPMAKKLQELLGKRRNTYPDTMFVASELPNGTEPRQLRNHIDKFITLSGLQPIHPHGLRHSFISRAINSGANIKAISELAGHSDVKITLDVYTHVNQKAKISAIQSLGE